MARATGKAMGSSVSLYFITYLFSSIYLWQSGRFSVTDQASGYRMSNSSRFLSVISVTTEERKPKHGKRRFGKVPGPRIMFIMKKLRGLLEACLNYQSQLLA